MYLLGGELSKGIKMKLTEFSHFICHYCQHEQYILPWQITTNQSFICSNCKKSFELSLVSGSATIEDLLSLITIEYEDEESENGNPDNKLASYPSMQPFMLLL